MSKSPKLGLTLTPASESSKTFIAFRTELAGDSADSNMMILDAEVGKLKEKCDAPFTWEMMKNGLNNNSL